MKKSLHAIGLGLLVVALAGCGGGGDGGGGLLKTRLKLQILWGPRSRLLSAPSSALGTIVTLADADPQGGDFVWIINRDLLNPGEYTADYESTDEVLVGTCNLTVTFCAELGGQGATVGTAQQEVTINPDGTGIGTISTNTVVASVEVPADQTITVGEHRDLLFTALDGASSLVAVTPGSALWEVISGGDKLFFDTDGHAEGTAPGTATVTATVDGITSPETQVTVLGPPSLADFQPPTADAQTTAAFDAVSTNLQARSMPPEVQALGAQAAVATTPLQLTSQMNGYLATALQGTPQQAASRQNSWTWTVTEGALTVTLQVTQISLTPPTYDWSLILDGTVDSQSFYNFPFLVGTLRRDWLDTREGWHQLLLFNDPSTQQPPYAILADGEVWWFDDGTSAAYLEFPQADIYFTWELQADGSVYLALWLGTYSSGTKLFEELCHPDGTGWLKAYCPEDLALAVDVTFSDWGLHGSATVYQTACTTPDPDNNPVFW